MRWIAAVRERLDALFHGARQDHELNEELREVMAFYRGPTGQKFVQKLPAITQESMLIGQRFGQSIGGEIRARMIEELRKRGHDI